MSDPVLRIKFEDASGKALIPPTDIAIPAKLKKRTALAVVAELAGNVVKEGGAKAVEALGFK